jgi:hypothetical protein
MPDGFKPPRTPWLHPFPAVVTHTTEAARDGHPSYLAAKAGDPDAATSLAMDLLNEDVFGRIREIVDNDPIVVPASAIEKQGFNAIPDAMALEIGYIFKLEVDAQAINQVNIVSHTRARGFHRLAHPAAFEGPVEGGRRYLIVDDHVGLGGTIASLKGHIETHGGIVIGATCLTASAGSERLALEAHTLEALRRKHGEELEAFWRREMGHGLNCLTEPEAGYLLRTPTLVRIRNQMAKGAAARGGQVSPEET